MTSFAIKIIAIIAMTLDHLSKIIGQAGLIKMIPGASINDPDWLPITFSIVVPMEIIGRIAFPLFAFFIVEGTRKTRSLPRYICRLFIFALISEPFYYFGFKRDASWQGFLKSLSKLHFTNVIFTLALGALAINIFGIVEKRFPKKKWFINIPVLLVIMFIAERIDCDYFYFGILLIAGLYFAKEKKYQTIAIVAWSFLIYIFYQANFGTYWYGVSLISVANMISASLSSVFIRLYNGERGPKFKWGFYIYYPAHIFAITLINNLISRRNF